MSFRIETERLLLRSISSADVDALIAWRNDPEVAELQDWPMPCEREYAEKIVAEDSAGQQSAGQESAGQESAGERRGKWWMWTIANKEDTAVLGDFSMSIRDDGITSIGITLAREFWGNGYGAEALDAAVRWMFEEREIVRIDASIHPENARSARMVENCGFEFVGVDRNTLWDRHGRVDELRYSLTPELFATWNGRPRHRPERIELVELSSETLRTVISLAGHHSQNNFVSPISASLASFAVPPFEEDEEGNPTDVLVVPWARVVEADGKPVGFVMVAEPTSAVPEAYLWRLLIDRMHQRRGIGRSVVEQVIEIARTWDTDAMLVSWVPGVGSPEPLYRSLGFEPTGKIHDGEIEARLVL